jgi:two-component system KDP operon response regulator KdpE
MLRDDIKESAGLGTSTIPILVVEDDVAVRRLLSAVFHKTEFRLLEAETAMDGLSMVSTTRPEIVLLDLGLPDVDGIQFVKMLREWSQVPVLIISAQGDEERKVLALEAGADDYVTKPFGVNELLARIRTAWRRTQMSGLSSNQPVIEVGDVKIDVNYRTVTKAGQSIHLTPIEYKLLLFLAKYSGRVVTHRQILSEVWGDDYAEEAQYLRVYVGYLRKKLEDDPSRPTLILTEPRVGYRLQI